MLFDKIKKPIFLKEDSSAPARLQQLNKLLETASPESAAKIANDIKIIEAGIYGENNIAFELKNSHLPMIILRDLCLCRDDLTAQIDYLVLTNRKIFVIECKNLFGNIEVNGNGDFIRTVYGKKEAIYSPVTQNRRHLELIKALRGDAKKSLLAKNAFEKSFYNIYASIIVLANPRTILNDRFAPEPIRRQVIRADHLIERIRKVNANENKKFNEKKLHELAQFFLAMHQEKMPEPTSVHEMPVDTSEPQTTQQPAVENEMPLACSWCGASMVLRTASKGVNKGNTFFGCSRYPKCRNILNHPDSE